MGKHYKRPLKLKPFSPKAKSAFCRYCQRIVIDRNDLPRGYHRAACMNCLNGRFGSAPGISLRKLPPELYSIFCSTYSIIENLRSATPINYEGITYQYAEHLCPMAMHLDQNQLNTYSFVKNIDGYGLMHGGPMVLRGKLKDDTIRQYEAWGYKTFALRDYHES